MSSGRPQRRGRRRGQTHQPETPSLTQVPWKQPTRHFPPTELATEDQIEAIHQTSLQILSEIGMDFLHPEARSLLAKAGARVDSDSERVRFDPEFIVEKIMYGGFTSNVDMQSGAPAFGTPEFMQTAMITGQLARRYKIPYRSPGVNAANALDAQADYESVFSLWGAIMGGAHLVLHSVGWMEGGLRASFEKMALGADLCGMVQTFLEPIDFGTDALAIEAVRDVGPGGHFFGTQHTLDCYKTAFYRPLISDWRNYETWEEAGKPEAKARMIEVAAELMATYEEPPMDPAVRTELEEFVERRKAEGWGTHRLLKPQLGKSPILLQG
jgi:trimethylamine:corrinoid methyltransferase-like protein